MQKASEKVKRQEELFFNNHPNGANKEDALVFLDNLKIMLTTDTSFDGGAIKNAIECIIRDYELNKNLTERIEKYESFKNDVKGLPYQGKKKSEEIAEAN